MKRSGVLALALVVVVNLTAFLWFSRTALTPLPFPFGNLNSTWPGEPNYWRDDLKALGGAAVPALMDQLQRRSVGEWSLVIRVRKLLPQSLAKYFPDAGSAQYRRLTALWALGEMGPVASNAVPSLTRFRDRVAETDQRSAAIIALAKIQPDNAAARSNFLALLTDSQQTPRFYAAQEFGAFSFQTVEELAPLISALSDTDGEVRANAAFSIAQFGPVASNAMPVLKTLLTDSYRHVPVCAAFALSRVSSENMPPALAVLTNALIRGTDLAESVAPAFFRSAGSQASPAIPFLEASLSQASVGGSRWEPQRAALALCQVSSNPAPRAVALVANMSLSGLPEVAVLGALGPAASNAVPRLRELERITISPTFRAALQEALAKITNAMSPR